MTKINESLIIGVDFSENDDIGVMVVGRQNKGQVNIINAFQGKDAEELYKKLTTVIEKEGHHGTVAVI